MIGLSSVNHIGCIRPSRRPCRRCWSRASVLLLSVRKKTERATCLPTAFPLRSVEIFGRKQMFHATRTYFNLLLTLSECSHLTQHGYPNNKLVKLLYFSYIAAWLVEATFGSLGRFEWKRYFSITSRSHFFVTGCWMLLHTPEILKWHALLIPRYICNLF